MPPIATELRRLRAAMGLTLMEFGARIGLSWQLVAAYETGRVVPPADKLLRILHATRTAAQPFRVERVARAVAADARAAA